MDLKPIVMEMRFPSGVLTLDNEQRITAEGVFWARELDVFLVAARAYMDNDKETKRRRDGESIIPRTYKETTK